MFSPCLSPGNHLATNPTTNPTTQPKCWEKVETTGMYDMPAFVTGTARLDVPNVKPATPGLYVRNGDVFHVRPKKTSPTQFYAVYRGNLALDDCDLNERKRSAIGKFVRGMALRLKPDERMTPEQVKAFGDKFGACAWCGHSLSSAFSIHLGMGPTCYRRLIEFYDSIINDTEGSNHD